MLPTEIHGKLQTGVSLTALTEYFLELRAQGAHVRVSGQMVWIIFPVTTRTYTVVRVSPDLWRLDQSGTA